MDPSYYPLAQFEEEEKPSPYHSLSEPLFPPNNTNSSYTRKMKTSRFLTFLIFFSFIVGMWTYGFSNDVGGALRSKQLYHCRRCSQHDGYAYVVFATNETQSINIEDKQPAGHCLNLADAISFQHFDVSAVVCGGMKRHMQCYDIDLTKSIGTLNQHTCPTWQLEITDRRRILAGMGLRPHISDLIDPEFILKSNGVTIGEQEKRQNTAFQLKCGNCTSHGNILVLSGNTSTISSVDCKDGVDLTTNEFWPKEWTRIACGQLDCNPLMLSEEYHDNMMACALSKGLVGYIKNYPWREYKGTPLWTWVEHAYSQRDRTGYATLKQTATHLSDLPEWDFDTLGINL